MGYNHAVLGVVALGAQAPSAPAFRIRAASLEPHLRLHDVALDPRPLLTDAEGRRFAAARPAVRASIALSARRRLARVLREDGDRWHTALVQRQVDLLPARTLERLAVGDRFAVLDVDDAIWADTSRAAGGHPLARLKGSAAKARWLAARSDRVLAGNDLLAEWLVPYGRDLHVVPSLVDVAAVEPRRHADAHRIVIGWIGSATTAPYLRRLAEPLARVAAAAPERSFELAVMGGPAPRVPGVDVVELPWTLNGERALLARMDVGLMPLPDTTWTRGKCAYKALTYMAAAVPVVCDDVGVSARVVGDGEAGLVPASADQWTEAIMTLARDHALRARLGATGRRRVEADFDVTAWAPRIAELLRP